MKRLKYFVITLLVATSFIAPLTACGEDPVDQACDTIEGMASQEDKAQEALDDFHADADAKDAEAQEILDMVE